MTIEAMQLPTRIQSIGHSIVDTSPFGSWLILARPAGYPVANITFFRATPTGVGSFGFADPGGPTDMTLTLPTVSVFDRLGHGDLYWLRKKVSIDLIYTGALPSSYPFGRNMGPVISRAWQPAFAWEGFTQSFSYGSDGFGLTLSMKGQLIQLDDYLAKPEFIGQPMPYEWAMARQFAHPERPALRMAPLQIYWPSWWTQTYTPPKKGTPRYMVPLGVKRGDKWTGLLTRETGSFEPVFSSYLTTLLSSMYTRQGRWALDLQRGRIPTLSHRNFLNFPVAGTAVVEAGSPAVSISSLEVDWSQALDIVYGQGVSLTGVAYSGMEVSSDGQLTNYKPLASRRQAYPPDNNAWLDLSDMPREVMLQMQHGLSEYDASKVALAHLERFGDPGVTGEVVLKGDVKLADGSVIPCELVRAGMPLQIRNLFGRPEGVTTHVTQNTVDLQNRQNTCTVDSKFRDALTVQEVRVRGRDAMNISRMLIAGSYAPPIPDELLPWNYAEGSGMIPSSPFNNSLELFTSMPDSVLFPWTKWTTAHPPKSGRWRSCYIHIPPASSSSWNNWAYRPREGGRYGIGVRMSQAGSIRLLQMAAYDRDGNVMKVPFHVSFYYMSGVNIASMPKILAGESFPPYTTGMPYPYVTDAFEQYNVDGTEKGIEVPLTVQTAQIWKAYGTDRVKAGYFPGDGTVGSGDTPTGLLVDETVQSFNTMAYGGFNIYTRKQRTGIMDAGWLYCMVYCDAQADQDVYFLGRMFRVEPGTQGGGA